MNNLIKYDYFLGNKKVLIGDSGADLVLLTLGKVYIKYGNNTKLLNDYFDLVINKSEPGSIKVDIVSTTSEQNSWVTLNINKDGLFLYNTLESILYITVNGELIPLINASDYKNPTYVKKSGDSMNGLLYMDTYNSPFVIKSKKLVDNLNVQYLNGFQSEDLAKKALNEYITGKWTFGGECTSEAKWVFNQNIYSNRDILVKGSIGSPVFTSGFGGYGWRLDADTNTLTVDRLFVRKALLVYELVVNKISATNGSLWISDASKVYKAHNVTWVDDLTTFTLQTDLYYIFNFPNSLVKECTKLNLANSTSLPENGNSFILPSYIVHVINSPTLYDAIGNNYDKLLDPYTYTSDFPAYLITIDWNKLNTETLFPVLVNGERADIKIYYKFFGNGDYYVIKTDGDEYPPFRVGDIVRCLKFLNGNIKYYDALVINQISSREYIVLKAKDPFDKYTEIIYDEYGNLITFIEKSNTKPYSPINTIYNKNTGEYETAENNTLGDIFPEDNLVRIGNILDKNRQNSIYLTASDDYNPYIDFISEVNRPDYSVIYNEIDLKVFTTGGIVYYLQKNPVKVDNKYLVLTDNTYSVENSEVILSDNQYYLNPVITESSEPNKDEEGNIIVKPNQKTRVRVGLLDGIYDHRFRNKQPRGYGLFGENVYLTGEFYLNNGKSVLEVSQDGVIAKYNNAGIEIVDDPNGGEMIVLDADKIAFNTDDGDPDLLILDGIINTKLLKFDTLEGQASNYKYIHTFVYSDELYTITGYPINSFNYIQDNYFLLYTFHAVDSAGQYWEFNVENDTITINSKTKEEVELPNTPNVKIVNDALQVSTRQEEVSKYTNISINKNKKGETILYWPDGSVMNAKVVWVSLDEIYGCIEYFFNRGKVKPHDLVNLSDLWLSNSDKLVKRINYFEEFSFIELYVINAVSVYLSDLYDFNDISDYINNLINNSVGSMKEDYIAFSKKLYRMYIDNSILTLYPAKSPYNAILTLDGGKLINCTNYIYILDCSDFINNGLKNNGYISENVFNGYIYNEDKKFIIELNSIINFDNFAITLRLINNNGIIINNWKFILVNGEPTINV